MVNATQGVLLESDVQMTQFVVSMNEQRPMSERFIIHVLDDRNLLVQPHMVDEIKAKMKEFQDANTYTVPTAGSAA